MARGIPESSPIAESGAESAAATGTTPLLDRIQTPHDIRGLTLGELRLLATEIREELVRVTTQNGGHLGANLGTVELTLALHAVFHSPKDKLVWDVGHQAYVHKLLTGRRDRFHTIRQEGGLSGFLSRDESEHDAFGAGHASTSISAALGMAVGEALKPDGERGRCVAILGDGALTGGMAFEALNNAGNLSIPLIVVLNDNEMSIAANVGAITKYLNRVRTDPRYGRARQEWERLAARLPQGEFLIELGKRMRDSLKEFVYHAMIWEELGFTYIGPVDGHDLRATVEALRQARQVAGPVFLHVVTVKGKGYAAAEADVERLHGVSAIAPAKQSTSTLPSPPKYQDVFAKTVIQLADEDPRVMAITAAMPTGTSLNKFAAVHPDRFFDVGIAEQHAVTFAAGLATAGLRPVAAIYSTFLQRAYDQIVHDVCIQHLPVIFAMDRAGFAGDDGRTHHGIYDLTYLRCLPNMTVMAPKDENELRHMLYTAVSHTAGPIAVRYPRGAGLGVAFDEELNALPIGRGETLRRGDDVALLAIGAMVAIAERAAELLDAEGIAATVINARFAKPLDEALFLEAGRRCGAVVTIEENVTQGGFGAGVLETFAGAGLRVPVRLLGIPDQIFEQASQARLRERAGLTPAAVAEAARAVAAAARDDVATTKTNPATPRLVELAG
ncbi:MAG: 1-deoxy-D-xylulose 5-phosphate synthase [uncultured Thermomicrobiales bacterium]|uniref:1-deoxy-D-xylulose-5-phosphate synthase n=1 Tax=uncultured Thermomicrobiales bacterium TaxID=1645740 RepID=A0A6J4U9V3_9BACT|nr:MAG: 1-deoxy-D-xylulose 5-phosphate synthase [uncultured Thermomicrobiales bacterium]